MLVSNSLFYYYSLYIKVGLSIFNLNAACFFCLIVRSTFIVVTILTSQPLLPSGFGFMAAGTPSRAKPTTEWARKRATPRSYWL